MQENNIHSTPPKDYAAVADTSVLSSKPEGQKPGRLFDLDRAKGLAIFLVVLGHLAREAPPGNEWYGVLKTQLYLFHMPFFMFLSGVTMYLSFKPLSSLSDYIPYISPKFSRLMPAFFVFGALTLAGKIIAAKFFPVDNPPTGFVEGLWLILTQPIHSAAGSLWYIYVLFLFYALLPLLHRLTSGNLWIMLAVGALVHMLPPSRWFMLGGVTEYLLYLAIGFWVATHYSAWVAWLDRYAYWLLIIFVALLSLSIFWQRFPKVVLGLFAIPALHALVRMSWPSKSNILLVMGAYTFSIYLLNTIAIGLVKGVAGKFIPWGGAWFPLLAALLLTSGILLPILTRRKIFARIPWLEKMTR